MYVIDSGAFCLYILGMALHPSPHPDVVLPAKATARPARAAARRAVVVGVAAVASGNCGNGANPESLGKIGIERFGASPSGNGANCGNARGSGSDASMAARCPRVKALTGRATRGGCQKGQKGQKVGLSPKNHSFLYGSVLVKNCQKRQKVPGARTYLLQRRDWPSSAAVPAIASRPAFSHRARAWTSGMRQVRVSSAGEPHLPRERSGGTHEDRQL